VAHALLNRELVTAQRELENRSFSMVQIQTGIFSYVRFGRPLSSNSRSRRRGRARGVTVFELCLVAAAVAVLTLGVLLLVRPRIAAAETNAAVKDASHILDAAQEWRRENGKGCPTLSQLVLEKQLAEDARMDDPWGERYRLRCTGEDVTVVFAGHDHVPNTDDDIRVPHAGG
jgi:general secretion pathway protein G